MLFTSYEHKTIAFYRKTDLTNQNRWQNQKTVQQVTNNSHNIFRTLDILKSNESKHHKIYTH